MSDDALHPSAILAALPTSDVARSEAYFTALIGRPVDERPMPVVFQWTWADVTLQIVDDPKRAGGGLVTIVVPDMSAALEGARERGLEIDADVGTVVAQLAVLEDPDGNQITVVEAR